MRAGITPTTIFLATTLALAAFGAAPQALWAQARGPQAGQLAFVFSDRGIPQIFVVNADGTGQRRLTGAPEPHTTPVWSPDGRRLAFVRQGDAGSQIDVMNADGGRMQRLTGPPGWSAAPSWSPDGRQIAFVLARNGPPRITVMRSDGTGQRMLSAHPGEHRTPAWSPDGRLIAFLSKEEGGYFDLYTAQADGSHLRRVATRPPGVQPDVKSFVWLPDGRLAYSNRTGPAQEGVTITTIDGAAQQFLGSASAPAWAPDGRRLAFVAAHVGGAQIYVGDATGAKPVRLTDPRLISIRPAWSPDGLRIAFLVIDHGIVTLSVMNADRGGLRALAIVYSDLSALPVFSWRPQ